MSLHDLYSGPSVGFEAPMEMLEACHSRVRRTLDLMVRLQAHLAEQGVTEQARSAASDILRYFDKAGPAHHQDEELHVIPRLRSSGNAELQALADRLQSDHRAMHEDWQALRLSLLALRDAGSAREGGCDAQTAEAGGQDFPWPAELARRYIDRYADHLLAEERVAFPAVAQELSPQDEAAMGSEMAARRTTPR